MLQSDCSEIPFPLAGSRAFERATGKPLMIIQQRGDGRVLCRREEVRRPGWAWNGPASGNVTLEPGEIVGSVEETGQVDPAAPRTLAGKPRKARPRKASTKGGAR